MIQKQTQMIVQGDNKIMKEFAVGLLFIVLLIASCSKKHLAFKRKTSSYPFMGISVTINGTSISFNTKVKVRQWSYFDTLYNKMSYNLDIVGLDTKESSYIVLDVFREKQKIIAGSYILNNPDTADRRSVYIRYGNLSNKTSYMAGEDSFKPKIIITSIDSFFVQGIFSGQLFFLEGDSSLSKNTYIVNGQFNLPLQKQFCPKYNKTATGLLSSQQRLLKGTLR